MPPYRHFLSLVALWLAFCLCLLQQKQQSSKQIGTISPPYACYVANALWLGRCHQQYPSKVTAAASAADISCGRSNVQRSMFNSTLFSVFCRAAVADLLPAVQYPT